MPSKRIAIVTGGNRGIGHEIARQLAKADLFVVIGARDKVKCENAVESLKAGGGHVAGLVLDVNDTKSVRRFVEEGAETAVWLSLLPSNGPSGQFFRDRKPIPW